MPRYKERNLGEEQKALAELAPQFAGFEGDQSIRSALERAIKQKSYGTSRPTFEKDYNIPRLQKEFERGPSPAQYQQQLYEKEKALRPKEEAAFANAFSGVKNPAVKESLMSQARGTSADKRSGLMERAANMYNLNREDAAQKLSLAEQRFNEAREEAAAIDAAEAKAAEKQADREFEIYMSQLKSGQSSRSGGGPKSNAPKTIDSLSQWVLESGVYGLEPGEAMSALQAQQMIENSKYGMQGFEQTGTATNTREALQNEIIQKTGLPEDLVHEMVYEAYPDSGQNLDKKASSGSSGPAWRTPGYGLQQ